MREVVGGRYETRCWTQVRAELRKGVRRRTLGRVKDWSWVLRGVEEEEEGSRAERARNSLFLRMRERVL
jgi:hypothetical protein